MNRRGAGFIILIVVAAIALAIGAFVGLNLGDNVGTGDASLSPKGPSVEPDLPRGGGSNQCRGDVDGDGDVDTDDLNIIIINEGCGGGSLLCYDTDVTEEYPNGVNPFEKGTVVNESGSFTDHCGLGQGSTFLNEFFCFGEGDTQSFINCLDFGSFTCVDGACVFFDATLPDLNLSFPSYQIISNNETNSSSADLNVSAIVQNTGGSASPPTTTRFHLSADGEILREVGILSPGETQFHNVLFTDINAAPGSVQFLHVKADYFNETEEITEDNNEWFITINF